MFVRAQSLATEPGRFFFMAKKWVPALGSERQKEIDNDAMKDFYQQRERERAEREKIAIEKAKEADRQAYRERGWPVRG